MEDPKYPIGKSNITEPITEDQVNDWIGLLKSFPIELEKLTAPLSQEMLDTPYRKDGWTIRQVVHHLADSHYNSYIRFKWALTENEPVIKAYYEDRWAELPDSLNAPVEMSLSALKGLHAKWVYLLEHISFEDLDKTFIHPEGNIKVSLKKNIGMYAWHSRHHYAHIENLLKRKGWL